MFPYPLFRDRFLQLIKTTYLAEPVSDTISVAKSAEDQTSATEESDAEGSTTSRNYFIHCVVEGNMFPGRVLSTNRTIDKSDVAEDKERSRLSPNRKFSPAGPIGTR